MAKQSKITECAAAAVQTLFLLLSQMMNGLYTCTHARFRHCFYIPDTLTIMQLQITNYTEYKHLHSLRYWYYVDDEEQSFMPVRRWCMFAITKYIPPPVPNNTKIILIMWQMWLLYSRASAKFVPWTPHTSNLFIYIVWITSSRRCRWNRQKNLNDYGLKLNVQRQWLMLHSVC